jgi:hypothetical protein
VPAIAVRLLHFGFTLGPCGGMVTNFGGFPRLLVLPAESSVRRKATASNCRRSFMNPTIERMAATAGRNRSAIVIGLAVALTSAGTAAAAAVVLGGINTSSSTTTFKSGKNGAVIQITNTNGNGGRSAKGLGITVPAGRAPITVNAGAGKATNLNADMVDNMDASAFLPAAGTAANSDALDGIDSTGFVRGNGTSRRGSIVRPPDGSASHFFLGYSFNETAPRPWVGLYYLCPTNLANNGAVVLRNEGDTSLNLFFDNGLTEPTYVQFAGNGSQYSIGTLAAGEHLSIQVHGSAGTATFEVYSVHRQTDCFAQGQAWYSY